jgi:ABC-2 type transport system permease protein
MRAFAVFTKGMREELRDIWGLVLALTTPPFFVLIYWSFTAGGSTSYDLVVINYDQPVEISGVQFSAGKGVLDALAEVKYPNGQKMLEIEVSNDRELAEANLRNRDAAALLILPEDLSRSLVHRAAPPAQVTLIGDLTNPMYAVAAVMATTAVNELARAAQDEPRRIEIGEVALGGSAARSEFEAYVPGLLIIAVLMVLFSAAMAVSREVEAGTLRRLQLTRMTAFDFLVGVSAQQVLIASCALALTLALASALGFSSVGPIWAAFVVGAVASLSVVGVGLIVACFAKTVTRSFLVANAPFMLMMFFSGAIYPMAKVELFTVGTRTVGLWDILPPTHAVVALNKILSLGTGIGEVVYELVCLSVLSLLYFGVGVWLLHRTHLRAA